VAVLLCRGLEPLELRTGERDITLGSSQVRHQSDDLGRRRRQLGEAVAAHARVELQVHANALRYLVVDNHELEPGVAGQCDLTVRAGRAHDDDPLGAVLVA